MIRRHNRCHELMRYNNEYQWWSTVPVVDHPLQMTSPIRLWSSVHVVNIGTLELSDQLGSHCGWYADDSSSHWTNGTINGEERGCQSGNKWQVGGHHFSSIDNNVEDWILWERTNRMKRRREYGGTHPIMKEEEEKWLWMKCARQTRKSQIS